MKTFIALSGLAGLVAAIPINPPSFSMQPVGPLKPTGAAPAGPPSGPPAGGPSGAAPFPFPPKNSGGFAAPSVGMEPHHHHHPHEPSFPTGKKPGEGESFSFPAPTATPSLHVRDAQIGGGSFQSDITTAPGAAPTGGFGGEPFSFPAGGSPFSFPTGGIGGGAAAPTGSFGGGSPGAGGNGGNKGPLPSFSFPAGGFGGGASSAAPTGGFPGAGGNAGNAGALPSFSFPAGGFGGGAGSAAPTGSFGSGSGGNGAGLPSFSFPIPTETGAAIGAPTDPAQFEKFHHHHHHSGSFPGFPAPTGALPSVFPTGFPFPTGSLGGLPGLGAGPTGVVKYDRVHPHHFSHSTGVAAPTGVSPAPSGGAGTGPGSAPKPSFSLPAASFTPVGPRPTHSASYWGA
ncbi:hypothetical protein LTR86_002454 [Recurvomyces mirabilis]|nr:hypothetical protein LTR86_002454 [Recurvomyces mirabilis]